jgi:hypothetical protein
MVSKGKRTIHTMTLNPIKVEQRDIDEGLCLLARKCMIKVAVTRFLDRAYPQEQSHRVRVDAGHIKFNAQGHRYEGKTPASARKALMYFDDKRRRHLVKPFEFKLTVTRMSKIDPSKKFTPARRRQINEARRRREADGNYDRQRYTLRKRVVGFA